MKKRTILLITLLMLSIGITYGQIIVTKEDEGLNPRAGGSSGDFGVMVPMQNVHIDQWKLEYVPAGNGLLWLVGLGGAYLYGKRKVESGKRKVKK